MGTEPSSPAPDPHPAARHVTETRELGVAGGTLLRARQPAVSLDYPPLDALTVVRQESASSRQRVTTGAGRLPEFMRRSELVVIAPGDAPRVELLGPSTVSVALLPGALVRETLAEAAPGRAADFGALHERYVRDPVIDALIDALWDDRGLDADVAALHAEAAARAIVASLWRRAGLARARAVPPRRLDADALARVDDYLEAHLAGGVTPGGLAAAAGVPAAALARELRAATGRSPARYALERRVARARERLERTDRTLAEVALECGFSSQSHMTSAFTRLLGTSPGRYRRERRR